MGFAHRYLLIVTMSRSHIVTAGVMRSLSFHCSLSMRLRLTANEITALCQRNYGSPPTRLRIVFLYVSGWKCSYTILAFAGPITLLIVSMFASRIRFTDLRAFRSPSRVFGPMPGILSSSECKACLERFSRWKVMAKRCTSS